MIGEYVIIGKILYAHEVSDDVKNREGHLGIIVSYDSFNLKLVMFLDGYDALYFADELKPVSDPDLTSSLNHIFQPEKWLQNYV